MSSFHSALLRWGSRSCCDYFGVSVQGLVGDELPEGQPHERNELMEYLNRLREHPKMRMLFFAVRNAVRE